MMGNRIGSTPAVSSGSAFPHLGTALPATRSCWIPRVRGSLSFDGIDDHVDLPHTLLDGAGDATIAFWVKSSKTGAQAILSGTRNGEALNTIRVEFRSGTSVRLILGGEDTTWTIPSTASGDWHHVAIVRDRAASMGTLFWDGQSLGTQNVFSGNPFDIDPGELLLGQRNQAGAMRFEGALDDLGIWRRKLSGAEVQALANRQPMTVIPSASAFWPFDDPGTTAIDVSGNGWSIPLSGSGTPSLVTVQPKLDWLDDSFGVLATDRDAISLQSAKAGTYYLRVHGAEDDRFDCWWMRPFADRVTN